MDCYLDNGDLFKGADVNNFRIGQIPGMEAVEQLEAQIYQAALTFIEIQQ